MNSEAKKRLFIELAYSAQAIKEKNLERTQSLNSLEIELKVAQRILDALSESKEANIHKILDLEYKVSKLKKRIKKIKKENL